VQLDGQLVLSHIDELPLGDASKGAAGKAVSQEEEHERFQDPNNRRIEFLLFEFLHRSNDIPDLGIFSQKWILRVKLKMKRLVD
jgi:hypothetical protein